MKLFLPFIGVSACLLLLSGCVSEGLQHGHPKARHYSFHHSNRYQEFPFSHMRHAHPENNA